MKSGIYTITNLVNGKIYLGCTVDFSKRKHEHFKKLKNNSHKNKHLQSSFLKYGEDKFVFEILIECDKEMLISEEHYWSNLLRVQEREFGYNQRPTHPYNKILNTPEIIEKIRNSLKGRKLLKESIQKRTETRLKNAKENGYYFSKETLKKKSINSGFRKILKEDIIKRNKLRTGIKKTPEQIKNSVEARKGYKHSQETKNKIGNGNRKSKTGV